MAKIEQVVKLIRSKGVGIYFITQSPKDVPDEILNQLGNKIQHALRAYTPSEMKAIRAAAASFRVNPDFDTATVLQELGTGEALISVLDEKGIPSIVRKCKILPPQSLMGPISDSEKQQEFYKSNLYLKYKDTSDPESAYEILTRLAQKEALEAEEAAKAAEQAKADAAAQKQAEREAAKAEAAAQKEAERKEKAVKNSIGKVASTAAGTVGREVGNVVGSAVGGKFGKKLGGNLGASLARNIIGLLKK
jgi:biotin carboxyl carrier protein